MTAEPARPLATDKDFARFAGVTPGQVAQLRELGRGPMFIRVTGRQIRYRWADIEEWLDTRTCMRSDQHPACSASDS